jgi:putative transposase
MPHMVGNQRLGRLVSCGGCRYIIYPESVRVELKQYAARAYRHLLADHGMLCSMSRKASCWDNAPIESFFGNMKTELDDGSGYQTRQEARNDLFQFIEGFYNRHRLHSAIGYITPMQKEQFAAAT